ncbi:hypothetical protein DSL72_008041 [Monilinia vaccinii-corymbosi]|uniref:trimethyllysine dioxygenase n=1 Tax=Monilinia vaccinii-corymbosi TaxID=61207 RepID=A0A8A3PJL7_9HELO|nr:hypothetical protein DSL72_008041 [Monilinia vaccinii-corymbosi]
MNRSILPIQRLSRAACRRCYSSEAEINHESNPVTRPPLIQPVQSKTLSIRRLKKRDDVSPSPKSKRDTSQFLIDPTHGPPVFFGKNVRPPHFTRPLLDDGISAQEKANQDLINAAADLGENIVHPKLGEGYRENYHFPRRWLRDNCRCAKCRRPDTMQREVNIFSSNLEQLPKSINKTKKEGLEVTWLDEADDDSKLEHVTLYPWDWLHKHKVYRAADKFQQVRSTFVAVNRGRNNIAEGKVPIPDPDTHEVILWDSHISLHPPSVDYNEVMASDAGVGKWTRLIHNFGFCFVDGVPVCPEKTRELLERIAFIRPTHYGGFYDFTSDLTMKDTAYTSEAIGPHTDTTYFTDPAGLQMFHLLSHTEGTGGSSLLVDGFWAAGLLRNRYKDALSKIAVPWHASGNEGINITPNRPYPVLTMDSNRKATQIRWNEADRGTIHPGYSQEWYEAAKTFHDRVNDPKEQYWPQLVPGRALIFDNWRILHGRTAFTGKRRMCGGYINRDDYISRYLNTNFTREEILQKIL